MKKTYLTLFLLLSTLILQAQVTTTSVWKWVNGDSTLDSHGRYGSRGVANAANSPYSRNGGRTWTDIGGNFWLFGGLGAVASGNNKLNDLWRFNPSTEVWTWISGDSTPGHAGVYGMRGSPGANNRPGGRTRSVHWIDASGNLWIYGGQGNSATLGTGQRYLSDLWRYAPGTNQWMWVSGDSVNDAVAIYGTKGVPDSKNSPGARNNAACWKDASGNFWLYGGFGFGSSPFGVSRLNDLWMYTPNTNEWTWVSGDSVGNQRSNYGTQGIPSSSNYPGSRELTINWTDASDVFWMFGGIGYDPNTAGTKLLNELWKYDPVSGEWNWVKGDSTGNEHAVYGTRGLAAAGNTPGSRQGSPGWVDRGNQLWVSGGIGYANSSTTGRLSDIWKYNPSTNVWTWVAGDSSLDEVSEYGSIGVADTANTPGGRSGHVAWIDGSEDVFLFGGFGLKPGSSGFENDVWKLGPPPGVGVSGKYLPEIVLYPNPAREGLFLEWNSRAELRWQIVDLVGRVHNSCGSNAVKSNSLFIDIIPLSAGMYYLQVRGEGFEKKQFSFLKL